MSVTELDVLKTESDGSPTKAEDSKMPNVEMVEVEKGVRGKGNKDKKVKFQAINEDAPRPDNPLDAAMQIAGQDLQKVWDYFTRGFNELAYESVADPIAEFIDASWDADKVKNFRMTVNAMSKLTGREKEEVAGELLKAIS